VEVGLQTASGFIAAAQRRRIRQGAQGTARYIFCAHLFWVILEGSSFISTGSGSYERESVPNGKIRVKNLLARLAFMLANCVMQTLPHTLSCFVCGELNPAGLRLRFQTDGRTATTRFIPQVAHVGFKGVVHGGIIATVLDEVMVWACAVQAHKFAVCAELTVRYLNPVKPGRELVVTGELTANRKGRLFEARATAQAVDGTEIAVAHGKYFPIKPDVLREFGTDLVGDTRWLMCE